VDLGLKKRLKDRDLHTPIDGEALEWQASNQHYLGYSHRIHFMPVTGAEAESGLLGMMSTRHPSRFDHSITSANEV
jgi:hypothetical protein